jgi:predicted nuclease of restriction endonuclease-like (RecB) superfamily
MSNGGTDAVTDADGRYEALLADLRAIIALGRGRAAAAINAEIVQTYWRIGERIVREEQGGAARAGYGEQLLARPGRVLSQEFGRGFAERSLRAMRQFFQTYPIRSALRAELTWTHYRTLLPLEGAERRAFYERMAATGRWSSRELEKQINAMLYERVGLARQPEVLAASLPDPQRALAPARYAEAFRDPYVLDFLGLDGAFTERDLERALVDNIERFLLELGHGFCFVGRQQRLPIGAKDYYVDLVFYHRYLRAPVLVDLKIGELVPADIAQMQLYLAWTRRYEHVAGEDDPIGLILCGYEDQAVIELLLADPDSSPDKRIKVAQYLLLDSAETLKERLAALSRAYDQAQRGAGPPDE